MFLLAHNAADNLFLNAFSSLLPTLTALLLILRKVTFVNSLLAKILWMRNLTGFRMELAKFIKDIKWWICL